MSEEEYDMIFKVVLIGDSGVGKSNILLRYLKNEFTFDTKATVGVEFGSKKYELNGYKVKAQIWDTAGQERYKSITNAYYKGAKGCLLVYDITRKETFDSVDRWIPDLRTNGDENVTILLIGNKSDIDEKREVSQEDGQAKAKLYNIAFMETSAKTSANIDTAFKIMIEGERKYLILEIFNKFHKQIEDTSDDFNFNEKGIEIISGGTEKKKKSCC